MSPLLARMTEDMTLAGLALGTPELGAITVSSNTTNRFHAFLIAIQCAAPDDPESRSRLLAKACCRGPGRGRRHD